MSEEIRDVTVLGAGPAGATAAILLAQRGYDVALIDRDRFPRNGSMTGWINSRAAALLHKFSPSANDLLEEPIGETLFHSADFQKTARPVFSESPGFVIDRSRLEQTLNDAIRHIGVSHFEGSPVLSLRLKDSSVVTELGDGQRITSRLLVLATGRGAELAERVGFHGRGSSPTHWIAQTQGEGPPVAKGKSRVGVVLGLNRAGSFAVYLIKESAVCVIVSWIGEVGEVSHALQLVCRNAHASGTIPIDLSAKAQAAKPVRSPAAMALDLDTHVGKHTLLIGDAGGFVAAASNEGIFPAMWSAQIAAEVIDSALQSKHSQDELMIFDAQWRMKMADYLRSPHTDIQFLLPLIFSNQPMADRMGRAFFCGENI